MDVDAYIHLLGTLERIGVFESETGTYHHGCDELIYVGGAVGAAELYSLLLGDFGVVAGLEGIGL